MQTKPIETPRVSRRRFLQASGALTVLVGVGGHPIFQRGVAFADDMATSHDARTVNAWVTIAADGAISIKFGATEMGQGAMTALPLILAEEMDADWSRVTVEQVHKPETVYGNPIFGGQLYNVGSLAVQGYFDVMRRTGASTRYVLMRAAAAQWGVDVRDLTTSDGIVQHIPTGRRIDYGALASNPDIDLTVPPAEAIPLKQASEYNFIGRHVPRVDIPEKITGTAKYAIDVHVEGMVYAAVVRPPVEGERVLRVDDAQARRVPGVIDVVVQSETVAVVAERWESALRARDTLEIAWSETSPFRNADSEREMEALGQRARPVDVEGAVWTEKGDARSQLTATERILTAEYRSDYAYHAQMEPLAVVVAVDADGGGADVWTGTQSQSLSTRIAAETLGIDPDRIRLRAMLMGGGFGRRLMFDREILKDALLISQHVKRPVKLIWTREDDLRYGWFRTAAVQTLRATVSPSGSLDAWHHRVISPAVASFFNPDEFAEEGPRDNLSMEGTEATHYDIPNLLADHDIQPRIAKITVLRSISTSYCAFAAESFMDEVAHAEGVEPIAFRRRHLSENQRALRVLDRLAGILPADAGAAAETGIGYAFAGYKKTMAAGAAEVSVDADTGVIRVRRFWTAVDAGLVIQPDNLRAQVEGAIVFAISGALKERVTIQDGRVEQSNFFDYEILRMSEMPDEIRVDLIDSNESPTSGGEIGVPMVAPAIANAFYDLTRVRLRHMPFLRQRVVAALNT